MLFKLNINLKTINQFNEVGTAIGRPNYFASILALFEITMKRDLALLRSAVDNQHYHQISQLCHRMKSSAYTLGADHFGDCLTDMESIAKQDERDHIAIFEMISALEASYPATVEALRSHC